MFETEFVQKTKTHILCSKTFEQKNSCHLRDTVDKYGRAGEASDDNITRSTRIVCWITEAATDANSEFVRLIAFPR